MERLCCCCYRGRSAICSCIRWQMRFSQSSLHATRRGPDKNIQYRFAGKTNAQNIIRCVGFLGVSKASQSYRRENTRKSTENRINLCWMWPRCSFRLSVCLSVRHSAHHTRTSSSISKLMLSTIRVRYFRLCRCRSIQTIVSFSCSFNFPFGHLKIENV